MQFVLFVCEHARAPIGVAEYAKLDALAIREILRLQAWSLGMEGFKGTLLGTPNREPQEYSRYIIGIYLPGSLYSIIFPLGLEWNLGFRAWGLRLSLGFALGCGDRIWVWGFRLAWKG